MLAIIILNCKYNLSFKYYIINIILLTKPGSEFVSHYDVTF